MSRPVLLVVHNPQSRTGQVADALHAKGWTTERCCPKEGQTLPTDLDAYAGVVVFGGPMGAYDDHLDFIRAELDWIPTVLAAGTPFFGVCLGAQMLARSLGAEVAPHPEGKVEIGYYRIEPTAAGGDLFAGPLDVYHWHGDGFELPGCVELLATGDIFTNQAFRYNGATYGVQFHPEMQEHILRHWMTAAAHKLGRPGARPAETQLPDHARHGGAVCRWLDDFIDIWLAGQR